MDNINEKATWIQTEEVMSHKVFGFQQKKDSILTWMKELGGLNVQFCTAGRLLILSHIGDYYRSYELSETTEIDRKLSKWKEVRDAYQRCLLKLGEGNK